MRTPKIKLISFCIALFGAIWAWMVHSSNLKYYHQEKSIRPMDMILTADDVSYIAPAYNFYTKGVWKDNSGGVSSYVQRPPMIGMINWVFLHFTESGNCQKYLATILHGLAIFCFGLICIERFGKKAGIILQSLYVLIPCFWGYLFYFLTESITASLMVFLMYGFYRFTQKSSPKWLLFQSFIIGILLLTRPQLVLFILPFFYFLGIYLKNKFHNKWLTVFLSLVIAFGGFTLWQIRTMSIAGGWKGIHPIYHVTNNSQYRPVHRSFGELFKIWEDNGAKFHGIMGYIWIMGLDPDTSTRYDPEITLQYIPPRVFKFCPKEKLSTVFTDYYLAIKDIYAHRDRFGPIEGETAKEIKLRNTVDSLTHVLRKKMWKDNYLVTPMHSARWMFTKSQLNLLIFQKKYRGLWWMEGLRYFCVALIAFITLLSISHIVNRKNTMFLLMGLSIFIYLFYLFFIQKINEERYFFPLLPAMLLLGAERLWGLLRKR